MKIYVRSYLSRICLIQIITAAKKYAKNYNKDIYNANVIVVTATAATIIKIKEIILLKIASILIIVRITYT